jgi:hypothetical protein
MTRRSLLKSWHLLLHVPYRETTHALSDTVCDHTFYNDITNSSLDALCHNRHDLNEQDALLSSQVTLKPRLLQHGKLVVRGKQGTSST